VVPDPKNGFPDPAVTEYGGLAAVLIVIVSVEVALCELQV
jgi:hypothetical protein